MVITMISMRVMQATFDQIADMIAMGDGFMTTIRPVNMVGLMPGTG